MQKNNVTRYRECWKNFQISEIWTEKALLRRQHFGKELKEVKEPFEHLVKELFQVFKQLIFIFILTFVNMYSLIK